MKNKTWRLMFPAAQIARPTFAASGYSGKLLDDTDLLDQLQHAERADWVLLRLVGCTALATLLLAAAIRLAA